MNTFQNMLHGIATTVGGFFQHQWISIHKFLLSIFHTDQELLKYCVLTWAGVLLIGTVLGGTKRIAVYNDFDDVFSVFICLVFPIVASFLVATLGVHTNTTVFTIAACIAGFIEFILLFVRVVETYQANGSFWRGTLALITKFSWAALLVLNLLNILGGTTKKKVDPKNANAPVPDNGMVQSLVCTGLIAVVIFWLVCDKRVTKQVAELIELPFKDKKPAKAA